MKNCIKVLSNSFKKKVWTSPQHQQEGSWLARGCSVSMTVYGNNIPVSAFFKHFILSD